MSWLDKLPTELKLYISQLNFDALAWLMLTDSTIYTHYTKNIQPFHDLFLEHEARRELVLQLFGKLHDAKCIPELTKPKPYINHYIYSYDRFDTISEYTYKHRYVIYDSLQKWELFNYINNITQEWITHRDNASDGRPLSAFITSYHKYYYKYDGQVSPYRIEL